LRPCYPAAELNAAITANGAGNAALTNLPRKINIGLSSTRDDFAHCHINDVGLKVCGAGRHGCC
jgi:ferredoxin-nitrite reductase